MSCISYCLIITFTLKDKSVTLAHKCTIEQTMREVYIFAFFPHIKISYFSYKDVVKIIIFPCGFKDRQQEAEHDLRYLTLFSGYCKHINILYMK